MKSFKSSYTFKRFEDLKILFENESCGPVHFPLKKNVPPPQKKRKKRVTQIPALEEEYRLFLEAMEGVVPLETNNRFETESPPSSQMPPNNTETETILKLKELILKGEGFIVADTPEYKEGTGYNVHPEIARKLHKGDYAIQDHIDLHGLSVAHAKDAFDIFLKQSVSYGRHGVLIVHGRGLSSPNQPVLKNKVIEWLNSGKWRKWMIAYTSARSCDGGAGATYVLLRTTPLQKRFRKKKKT